MSVPDLSSPCPCGGESLGVCCGRYLASVDAGRAPLSAAGASDTCVHSAVLGEGAPTAQALMRSRYTAFVLMDAPYLLATWAQATRPAQLALDADTRWVRLLIQDTVAGLEADTEGVVEFTAVFQDADGRGRQHERSTFTREAGRWVYVDGQLG